MNSTVKTLLAGLALTTLSSTAFADGRTSTPEIDNAVSTKTRAEVRAELAQALAQNRIARNEADEQRLAFADFVPTKTRAQVVAETHEAMRLGLIPRGDHEMNKNPATAEKLRMVADAGLRANGAAAVTR